MNSIPSLAGAGAGAGANDCAWTRGQTMVSNTASMTTIVVNNIARVIAMNQIQHTQICLVETLARYVCIMYLEFWNVCVCVLSFNLTRVVVFCLYMEEE